GGVVAGADGDLVGLALEDLDQLIPGLADGDTDGDRHAPLARRAERGGGQMVGGEFEVGVGQHDGVVFRAAKGLHAFAGGGAAFVHVFGDGGGADEGDGGDAGVVQDRVHRGLVAVDDVEHAVREPGLGVELGDQAGGRRVAFAGFENEGVAGGDGDGVHPQRDHDGEVERGDPGAHAQGLAEV